VSGDQIVTSSEIRDALLRDFPDAVCVDMETAAIAQVAQQNGLPWGAVRVTSDSADETFDLAHVVAFGVNTASDLFERIIRGAMRKL
jgi:adenosylhomocysteine nucleosidase